MVLIIASSWKPAGDVVSALGMAIPGIAGLVIGVILAVLVLFWIVCLFLLPIIVYFIYRTVLKIEQNTRPK